ncbi:MAG: AI-2E family transporter [Thermoanaerobaculia bacterium]
MEPDDVTARDLLSRDLVELMIRVGLIAFLVVMAGRIFAPFMGLMLWALILAVAHYPLHRRLASMLGGRQGSAATVLVVIGLLLIGIPTAMLGSSFAGQIHTVIEAFTSNSVTVKPPNPAIAEWPLVGERLHAAWSAAAADLPAFLERMQPQLGNMAEWALSMAAGTMGAVLMFLGAWLIAGVMMAFGESGSAATGQIFSRLAGAERGPKLQVLSTATIRSVATGVIGVAFIQALLLGIGFVFAGVPAAGVLALIVMIVGIVQLPASLISLPVIGYLWWAGEASTTSNVIWTVYLVVAGLADNVLKPVLLGRGVDAPMPIVLIGALGGMVSAGIVGLFIGAVLLAVGYQIFMDWVNEPAAADQAQVDDSGEERQDAPASA